MYSAAAEQETVEACQLVAPLSAADEAGQFGPACYVDRLVLVLLQFVTASQQLC